MRLSLRFLLRLFGSLRIVTLLACGVAVVGAMLVATDRSREQADRARRAQVLMERVRSGTQQVEIVTLRSRAARDQDLAATVRAGFEGYKQVVSSVRGLRALAVPPENLREVDRDVGVAYGIGINAMAVSQSDPVAGRTMALTAFGPALDRLAGATGRAAHRQDRVARAALLRARIATTGSLAVGLMLLVLLGWRLHRLQRGSALAEQTRAAERRGELRVHALIRHSADVVAVIDTSWRVRWLAESVRRMLGYEPEALLDRPLTELVHPDDAASATELLNEVAEDTAGDVRTASLRLRDHAGEYRHLELVADNRLADPLIDGILLNIRDVSERVGLLEQLHHQAFHDGLTGLANRALLEERVEQALVRCRRTGGGVAVIFLDLDDFKAVNDGLGHAVGDDLLRAIAGRIDETLRPQDTPARFGGDEFAMLLEDLADEAEALAIAERLRRALEQPVTVAGRRLTPSASVGIAYARPGDTHDTLLRNADVAMYAAKRQGKARVAAFDSTMHDEALERFELSGSTRTTRIDASSSPAARRSNR